MNSASETASAKLARHPMILLSLTLAPTFYILEYLCYTRTTGALRRRARIECQSVGADVLVN